MTLLILNEKGCGDRKRGREGEIAGEEERGPIRTQRRRCWRFSGRLPKRGEDGK